MKKISFIVIVLLLSGCYNYRELNELGITTAISIDYRDDNFEVIAEVVNPIKQQDASSSNNSPFVSFSYSAPSLQEAFRNIVLASPRQLYASQLEIIILSSEVVNDHLAEFLEYFSRDPETRTEIKVIVAETDESIKGIMLQTLLTNFNSSNLLKSLEVQSKVLGVTYAVTFNELLNMYFDPNLEVVLPSMILEGNIEEGDEKENITTSSPKASIRVGSTTIVKDNKVLGFLDMEQSKMVSLINGKLKETIIRMEHDDGYVVFEPDRIKVSKEADVIDNTIKLEIKGYAKIKEVNAQEDIRDVAKIKELNGDFNKEMEKRIVQTFEDIRRDYNTDMFGFRSLYYKSDYRYFKKYCLNWYEDVFPKIKLEVRSDIKLYEKGNTLGGVMYERKNYEY